MGIVGEILLTILIIILAPFISVIGVFIFYAWFIPIFYGLPYAITTLVQKTSKYINWPLLFVACWIGLLTYALIKGFIEKY
jgi:hypothetical protein